MKNFLKHFRLAILLSLLVIFLLAMLGQFSCSCYEKYEYVVPLTVSNRTSEPINIYVKRADDIEFAYVGQVPAKKSVEFLNSHILTTDLRDVLIEARSEDDVVIFSKIFTTDELETLKFKVTIQ